MRDIFLVLATLAGIGAGFYWPFAGTLIWAWFSLMSPQSETYGFAQSLPLNLIVAVVAIARWGFSRETKKLPNDPLIWLALAFLAWCTLNGFVAVDPAWSWVYWDRTWKIFALGILVAIQANSKPRLHALAWIAVISLFYYGVKGGLFTLLSGGHSHVYGPQGTIIGDNNQLALALLMTLPLANYLRGNSANPWVRRLLLVAIALTVVAILGTYSRGGAIGLAVLTIAAWLKFRKKFSYLVVAAMVLVPVLYFMPESFFARLHSIDNYNSDASFQGRVVAWHVAFDYARDHFPFGAGFYGPQLAQVFHYYYPDERLRAAHSIYFQVLGEQGVFGLLLYLTWIVAGFVRSQFLARRLRALPDHKEMAELIGMIQLGLLVFCLSGAALSMAYYDLFVLYIGMLVAASRLPGLERGRVRRLVPPPSLKVRPAPGVALAALGEPQSLPPMR